MSETNQRATRLFGAWNARPDREPEDRYVTVDEFAAVLDDVVDAATLSDDTITEIVTERARTYLAEDATGN